MVEQEYSDEAEDDAQRESLSPLVKTYIDKQVEDAVKHHAEARTKVKKWRNSWRGASPITKGSFIMTAGIAGATIAYAFIAAGQLQSMREIAADNSRQTQQLIDAANQLKQAGWAFSGSALGINNVGWSAVGRLQQQADQVARSAKATESAANTAKDTLHISERAFLYVFTPSLDLRGDIQSSHYVVIPFANLGRITSGPGSIELIEVTIDVKNTGRTLAEGHWSKFPFTSLAPVGIAGPSTISAMIYGAEKGNFDGTNRDPSQMIEVAGTVSYNDGFPATPQTISMFCFHSYYENDVRNQLSWIQCDPQTGVAELKQLVHYPDHYMAVAK